MLKEFWQVGRYVALAISGVALYSWNYAREISGNLISLADLQFYSHAASSVSVYMAGSAIGSIVLISIYISSLGSPIKHFCLLYGIFRNANHAKKMYKFLCEIRPLPIQVIITILSILILYISFTGSLFYFFQALITIFVMAGAALNLTTVFFSDRGKKASLKKVFERGMPRFLSIYLVLLVGVFSALLPTARVTKLVKSTPSLIQFSSGESSGVILGATSTGIFWRKAEELETPYFATFSIVEAIASRDNQSFKTSEF